MVIESLALILVGILILVAGAELLVRGAASMASKLRIPPLAIGLTVVAYGTSSPELAASVVAAVKGQHNLAVGNVVGSNIFNVLFILGISALISPLIVASKLVRVDVPIMLCVSALALLISLDGTIGPIDGGLLLGGLITYTVFAYRTARSDTAGDSGIQESGAGSGSWPTKIGMVVGGLAVLVFGARVLVKGSIDMAAGLGVSETIIGLTIVAAGTSMPEVATSIMAGLRGQRDIAVGNVVGSNIFNILGVLGASALASGAGLPVSSGMATFDFAVMIGTAVLCLPIFFTRHLIARWEGFVLLAFYAAYTVFLIMDATGHDKRTHFSSAMLWFVLPMTAVTMAVLCYRQWRESTASEPIQSLDGR